MTNYARKDDTGHWVDVYSVPSNVFPDLAALKKALGASGFIAVDDAVVHGDIVVGSSGYQHQPDPVPLPVPIQLKSASSFQDGCEAAFGGGVTGATRFGEVMRAMATSDDDLVFGIYQRFLKSDTFDRARTSAMLVVLVGKTIVTSQESAAILSAWK